MKKRLCLFMMFLLLFMSAGCSQTTSQTSSSPTAEPSKNVTGSTAKIDPNSGEGDNIKENIAGTNTIDSSTIDSNTIDPSTIDSDNIGGNLFPDSVSTNATHDNSTPSESSSPDLPEDGSYTSKEDVALYIHLYGHLPPNFITKKEAEKLGWKGGSLEPFAPGMCIGGSRFGNYEGALPEKDGRSYTECDIDTLGADKRGAKRIVFSNDGLIYYTEDHYESFELLYGGDGS